MDLVAYLLCYTLEIKDKPRTLPVLPLYALHLTLFKTEQHGLCRALSYIIQTLSAETTFGVKLANPIKAQLPAKWSHTGSAADFMINVRLWSPVGTFTLLTVGNAVYILYSCDHLRSIDLSLSRSHYRTLQFCAILQEPQRHILGTPDSARHVLL